MATGAAPGGGANIPALQNRTVQIIIAAVLLVILIAGGIFFAINAGRNMGAYKPLLRGVDQSRALEIAAQLKSAGIDAELVPSDTGGVSVQVREKQFDAAVLEMAKSDLLLTDDFKLFDKTDWAASDYEKRVKYMRAVGGELSRLVGRMEGIRWGKVHVTIPPEKVFASRYEKDKTSASVTVELEPGRTLSPTQVESIISLVSGYVPEITPDRISIIDTKGRIYSSASGESEGGGVGGSHAWAANMIALNSSIERRVQSYLDGLVGAGKSRVAVSTRVETEKRTQNKTVFFPGAIGTHEYSEEALGDAAAGPAYTGTNNFAPAPRPVEGANPYTQSQGYEMVDPRLQKDMPGNTSLQGHSPQGGMDPSKQPSPYENGGVYNMGQVPQNGNLPTYNNSTGAATNVESAPMANPNDPTRFVCAANDEVCKRNYRRHNFAIQSYPSYEQTVTETPAGSLRSLKVSVVVERGSLPVSISQLKEGIAAAADPSIGPDDVQVVLGPPKAEPQEKKENKVFLFGQGKDEGGFQWWWIPLVLLVIVILFFLLGQIGNFMRWLLTGKPKNFREEPLFPPAGARNPLDRLKDYDRPAPPPPPPPAPAAPATPSPFEVQDNFPPPPSPIPQPQPRPNGQNDLPFDLDDEFAIGNERQAPQTSQPQQRQPEVTQRRPTRERPRVVIEDDT